MTYLECVLQSKSSCHARWALEKRLEFLIFLEVAVSIRVGIRASNDGLIDEPCLWVPHKASSVSRWEISLTDICKTNHAVYFIPLPSN